MECSDEWFIFCFFFFRMTIFGDVMWRFSIQRNTTIRSFACVFFRHDGIGFIMMDSQMIHIQKWSHRQFSYDEEYAWGIRDQTDSRKQVRGDVSRRWKVCSDWWNELFWFLIIKEVWIILTTGIGRTSLKISKCPESEERIMRLTNRILMKRIEESNERV